MNHFSRILSLIITLALCASASADPRNPDISSTDYWQMVFAEEQTVEYPIVFVHGIAGGFSDWDKTVTNISGGTHFSMRFNNDGELFNNYNGIPPTTTNWIWNVSYYHDTPVKEAFQGNLSTYAERLREIITVVKNISGSEKVVLISHSMGGLVARAYMSLDETCWNSVHKIVTVAAPNEGVKTSVSIVGQLKDLRKGSDFIVQLNADWLSKIERGYKDWGVIGAVDINADETPSLAKAGSMTDSGGIGFIELSSAIPFSEWMSCVDEQFGVVAYDTPHFGYRVAIRGEHNEILQFAPIYRIIEWALQP